MFLQHHRNFDISPFRDTRSSLTTFFSCHIHAPTVESIVQRFFSFNHSIYYLRQLTSYDNVHFASYSLTTTVDYELNNGTTRNVGMRQLEVAPTTTSTTITHMIASQLEQHWLAEDDEEKKEEEDCSSMNILSTRTRWWMITMICDCLQFTFTAIFHISDDAAFHWIT